MKIVPISQKAIDLAVETLKQGGLVIYPTETVYGIGADATNEAAIRKLNNYKRRPLGKPYSIAVENIKMAEKYARLNKTARSLYKEFLPGPLTIISTGRHILAPGVESETGTIGIRIPDYKIVLDIIKKFKKPITATSANASYQKRPYKISDILDNISQKQKKMIDLILDAGTLPENEPSTVIDTTLDDPVILRQGDIKIKETIELLSRSTENTQNIGKEIWQKYEKYKGKRPIIFALEGPMGVGKTQFTKGVAKAMQIEEEVVSPTYSLEQEYGDGKLYHIDVWRIQKPNELIEIGFDEILKNKDAVVSIEWAEKVLDILRKHSEDAIIVWVKIAFGKQINERIISWGTL